MNKLLKSLLSVFLAVFMVVSVAAVPSSAAASLSKTSITLTKGYQTTLTVTGASGVTWSTGDKSVATVSSTGKVVGKSVGTTYIYAKAGTTTLKCKVSVVAAKITASTSSVSLDKSGNTKTVTLTVKGQHSGLSVGTTNKNVATVAFVRPIKWDGDKINIKITAKNNGTAKIKAYLKNYPSTCYKFIEVSVGDDYPIDDDDETPAGSTVIMPYTKNVEVAAGGTYNLEVYSSNQNNLAYTMANTRVATVTAGSSSNNYRNYTIKGVSAGTTTLKIYDKSNSKNYSEIKITVTGTSNYYEFYTTRPAKLLSTDQIIEIQAAGSGNYYMLVPAKYDPAYTNTMIAQKFNKYEYYKVYNGIPARASSTDTYETFYHTNSDYPYGARYILLPAERDEVMLNTAKAKYNNSYEYYVIYNESPVLTQGSWDRTISWNINDAKTGKIVTRYLLVPYNYDQTKVDEIKNKDQNSVGNYNYYIPYSTIPTVDTRTSRVVWYRKENAWKYMVVPVVNPDIIKANDAIYKDTGIYEYCVMYTTAPTPGSGEAVISGVYGNKTVYVLYNASSFSAGEALTYAETNWADGTK